MTPELAALLARREALRHEIVEFTARIHEIRAAVGNPFYYSRPEHADEVATNYTGYSSHAVVLPTLLELSRVEADIRRLTTEP